MKNNLEIRQTGYGHCRITTDYYGRQISTITTNSMAIDDYNSDYYEKEGKELIKKRGYNSLRNEIIRNYKK